MTQRPTSENCPSCGTATFRRVRPIAFLAIRGDRECLRCGTRYAPRVPRWGVPAFWIAGIAIGASGAIGLPNIAWATNFASLLAGGASYSGMIVLGGYLIWRGIVSRSQADDVDPRGFEIVPIPNGGTSAGNGSSPAAMSGEPGWQTPAVTRHDQGSD